MKRIATALALVLALPLAVAAQEEEHEMGQEHEMEMEHGMMEGHAMHGGMAMMMMHPGPGMMLQAKDELGLTDAQVAELEAMHAKAHEEMQAHREAAKAARETAHQAMMGAGHGHHGPRPHAGRRGPHR